MGQGCVFEEGTRVFHPENVYLGDRVYIGHQSILKGYYQNHMRIGHDVWVGPQCFLHSAGGIDIEDLVGIGPGVRILSSVHQETAPPEPIILAPLRFAPVFIGRGADIGTSATVLPGVRIRQGAQIGAGAVVTEDIPDYAIAVGVPAKVLRTRS